MKQVVWLREEFRLMDNQAILEAFKHKAEDEKILLFFNLNPAQFLEGTYNHDYFFQALLKFIEYLKTEGIRMHLIVGTPIEAWQQLISTYPTIETVFLNEATAGNGIKRDLEVTAMLEKFGIKVKACQDRHLCGPHAVLKKTALLIVFLRRIIDSGRHRLSVLMRKIIPLKVKSTGKIIKR